MGKPKELSVSELRNYNVVQENELLKAARSLESLRLTFVLQLTESSQVLWETVLAGAIVHSVAILLAP